MSSQFAFSEVLAAAEQLDVDAQAQLVSLLSRQLAERGRERVAAVIDEARKEFAAGQYQVMSAKDLIREARS